MTVVFCPKLIFDWLHVGRSWWIFRKKNISRTLARVSCHDWMFSAPSGNRSGLTWKTSFFEDQTTAETKDLARPVHPTVRLWTAFRMFVCVCGRVCVWGPVHRSLLHTHICVCVHERVGPHILLVLQNLTSLHWTLAVYTGNCSPCPNLPLPARVSHRITCLAAGALCC